MAKQQVYDINSPDGIGMYMDKVYSTPENAQIGFEEWKKRFEHQGYYRDNNRNMIPLNELRNHCRLVDFEIDTDEYEGEII
jgi:hypothetical protein